MNPWSLFIRIFLIVILFLSSTSVVIATIFSAAICTVLLNTFKAPAPNRKRALSIIRHSKKNSENPVIAHRGAGWDCPENTLEAVKLVSLLTIIENNCYCNHRI